MSINSLFYLINNLKTKIVSFVELYAVKHLALFCENWLGPLHILLLSLSSSLQGPFCPWGPSQTSSVFNFPCCLTPISASVTLNSAFKRWTCVKVSEFVCGVCTTEPCLLSCCGVYIKLWLSESIQSSEGVLLLLLGCWGWNRINRHTAEQSRADPCVAPSFGKEPLFTVCDAGSKGRGEGNHSHILSLCALIHRGSCLYTLIWLRQSWKRDWGRKKSIFLYISEVALHFLVVCNFDGQGRKNIYHNLLLLAILIRLRHSSSMRCRHPYSKTSWVCCWGQRWCPYALRGIFFLIDDLRVVQLFYMWLVTCSA